METFIKELLAGIALGGVTIAITIRVIKKGNKMTAMTKKHVYRQIASGSVLNGKLEIDGTKLNLHGIREGSLIILVTNADIPSDFNKDTKFHLESVKAKG